MTIREIAIALGFSVDKSSISKAESSIKGLKNMAVKALSTIGIGLSLKGLNEMLEEWELVNRQVNSVTEGLEDHKEAQSEILDAANNCRMAYKDMATGVATLLKTGNSFFGTSKEAASFLTLANQAFKVSGATASQIGSLNNAITSAFTTGRLSASGFNNILSASPNIIKYLAEHLNMTERQVKALGLSGNITAKQLYGALSRSSSDIEEKYQNLNLTISETFTIMKNKFGAWLAEFNETTGITNDISKTLLRLFNSALSMLKRITTAVMYASDKVGGLGNLLKIVLITIMSIKGALSGIAFLAGLPALEKSLAGIAEKLGTGAAAVGGTGILASLKGIGKAIAKIAPAIGKAIPWVLLIIAIIAALLTALEDIAAFFRGESSVAQEFFAMIGVSAEDLKATLARITGAIGSLFSNLGEIIGKVIGAAGSLISGVLCAVLYLVIELLAPILEMVAMIIDKLMPALNTVIEICMVLIIEVVEILMKLVDLVVDILVPILEMIMELLEPIMDLLVMLLEAVLDPILSIVGDLCDLIDEVLNPVLAVLKQILDPIIGILKNLIGIVTPIIRLLTNLLEIVLKPLTSIISALAKILSGTLGAAFKSIMGILQPVFDILSGICNLFEKLFGWISDGLGDVADAVSNWAGGIVDTVTGAIGGAADTVKGWLGSAADAIGGGVKKGWNAVKSGVKKGWNTVKGWFGLAEGGYIGANKPTPVVIGDNKNEGEIVSPISKMKQTVLDALRAFVGNGSLNGKTEAVSTIMQQSINRNVSMNVSMYNTFEGSKDVQKTTSKAMKQSARDISRELANALAYAR